MVSLLTADGMNHSGWWERIACQEHVESLPLDHCPLRSPPEPSPPEPAYLLPEVRERLPVSGNAEVGVVAFQLLAKDSVLLSNGAVAVVPAPLRS